MHGQTDRQMDRWTVGQHCGWMDAWTNKQTDRQMDRQTDIWMNGCKDRQHRHEETVRQKGKHRQTDRQTHDE